MHNYKVISEFDYQDTNYYCLFLKIISVLLDNKLGLVLDISFVLEIVCLATFLCLCNGFCEILLALGATYKVGDLRNAIPF